MARRRERNRVLARKTRLRKKFFFESLQQQAAQLSSENEILKEIVRKKLDGRVQTQILASSSDPTPSVLVDPTTSTEPTTVLNRSDFGLVAAIQTAQRSFVITDPSLPDNPIIFASKGFLDLTGYPLDRVLGRNCRFMQVADTDPAHLKILKEGIEKGVDTSVCMLNAKADGTLFYNHIFVAALRDANSNIVNYVGVQLEVGTMGCLALIISLFSHKRAPSIFPHSGEPPRKSWRRRQCWGRRLQTRLKKPCSQKVREGERPGEECRLCCPRARATARSSSGSGTVTCCVRSTSSTGSTVREGRR